MSTRGRRFQVASTSILDTLFPPACAGCGRRGHWVCGGCLPTVPPLVEVACDRCGALSPGRCVCDRVPAVVVSIRSAMPFDGWVRQAIHAFKYEGERARARHLGDLLPPLLGGDAGDAPPVEAVVPVPLHPGRMRERGFNQAALLAARVAEARGGIPVVEIARRGSSTPQVGLTATQRDTNVAGAFVVTDPDRLAGRSIVLIDDVITTTSTMTACARAIADAGAASIRCLSVARAV